MVISIAPDIGHELLSFCRQIAAGLDYLSKKYFVHRDLATRNILLSDDYVCKVRMHNIATYGAYVCVYLLVAVYVRTYILLVITHIMSLCIMYYLKHCPSLYEMYSLR